jgi:transposase
MSKKVSSEKIIKDIRRRTRTKYSSEKKIRIVLDGIRGEIRPAELCRRESISYNLSEYKKLYIKLYFIG